MKLTDTPFVVFDVETTGVDPATARIVEFGAAAFEPRKAVVRHRALVNPGVPIPAEATAIHRVDDAAVAEAPPFGELAPSLAPHFADRMPVGFNALAYDVPVIAAELERAGVAAWRIRPEAVLDVCLFVRWHLRHLRSRKLTAVAAHLGVEAVGGEAHSAAVDCQLTGEVLLAMVARGILEDDVQSLYRRQTFIGAVLEQEFATWSYWLYRDRASGELRLGAGKHVGTLLDRVDPSYCRWLLGQPDMGLPELARERFKARAAGQPAEVRP